MGTAYDVIEVKSVLPLRATTEIHQYLGERFNRALLLLGDLTRPLVRHTRLWLMRSSSLLGVAGVFSGFRLPIIVIVGSTTDISHRLLAECRRSLTGPAILVSNADDPFATSLSSEFTDEDLWLTRATAEMGSSAIAVTSAPEVHELYNRCGVAFWMPSMLDFGHYFGACDSKQALISTSGVNFVLPDHGYAQIGGVATDPGWRRQGLAAASLEATISSLRRAHISTCGLFVDSKNDWLFRFYVSKGFRSVGRFRFYDVR